MLEVTNIVVYRLENSIKNFIEVLDSPIDVKIDKDLKNDDKRLTFRVMDSHLLQEEDYLVAFGDEWVVKEISKDGTHIEIGAIRNIEKIEATTFAEFLQETKTLSEVLNELFSYLSVIEVGIEGWTYSLDAELSNDLLIMSRRRTIQVVRGNAAQVIASILDTWYLEVSYDTINKHVTFYKKRGGNKGSYFTSQLNLRKIKLRGDSYEFATRLIPIGKEDLNISTVNGGSVVLENYQYSEKVITQYWVDTRYENAASLKEDGLIRLNELSKPVKMYTCDIIDLSGQYPILAYDIGDTITIIDEQLGIRDVQRIVKMTVYPFEPELNTAELANRLLSFSEMQEQLIETRDVVRSVVYADGKISGYNVQGKTSTFYEIEEGVDAQNQRITQIQQTTEGVVTDVIDLSDEVSQHSTQISQNAAEIETKVGSAYVDNKVLEISGASPNRISNLEYNYENGDILFGVEEDSSIHIRSKDFYEVDKGDVTFQIDERFEVKFVVYDNNFKYSRDYNFAMNGTISFTTHAYFKVVIKNVLSTTMAPIDIVDSKLKVANESEATPWNRYVGDLSLQEQKELYRLEVVSRKGTTFDKDTQLVLDAILIMKNVDITSTMEDYRYQWYRRSKSAEKDKKFNDLIITGPRLQLGPEFLDRSATYICKFAISDTAYFTDSQDRVFQTKSGKGLIAHTTQNGRYRGVKLEAEIALVNDTRNLLESLQSATEQNAQSIVQTVSQTKSEILDEIAQNYIGNDEMASYRSTVSTNFSQTAYDFEFKFSKLLSSYETFDEETRARFDEIVKYIRFEDGNIVLGDSTNKMILKIESNRIAFIVPQQVADDVVVAYFSNDKLYVLDGQYENSLTVGRFGWIPLANGSLTFGKVK